MEYIINGFAEYVGTVLIAGPLLYAAGCLYISSRDHVKETEDNRLSDSSLESLSQNKGDN